MYRRYEAGQQPFWTPLRFQGQYYDIESDLLENWNRYYDPWYGRYLQSEPLLGDSQLIRTKRQFEALKPSLVANQMPAYAYAINNPINSFDPNGLAAVVNLSGEPLDASGNPGPGQGQGDHVPIIIPPCGRVDHDHPTPEDVRDVDALGGMLGKGGYKIRGNDRWPTWYCYKDVGDKITCLPQPPWLWCIFHPDAPSCQKECPCKN